MKKKASSNPLQDLQSEKRELERVSTQATTSAKNITLHGKYPASFTQKRAPCYYTTSPINKVQGTNGPVSRFMKLIHMYDYFSTLNTSTALGLSPPSAFGPYYYPLSMWAPERLRGYRFLSNKKLFAVCFKIKFLKVQK